MIYHDKIHHAKYAKQKLFLELQIYITSFEYAKDIFKRNF